MEWSPPVLTFAIERQGRTCFGSTRADLQRWTINCIEKTAACEKVGHRQLRPVAARVPIQPEAEEIAAKIIQGEGDERLVWQGDGSVRVVLSAIFPSGSGFKQPIEGRRKRLKVALLELLGDKGWSHVRSCVFIKEARLSMARSCCNHQNLLIPGEIRGEKVVREASWGAASACLRYLGV